MEDIKVSVIIPIYNVERFIVRCAESLMRQTLKEVEYIFVNDATLDGSMELLNDVVSRFPDRIGCVTIINLKKNEGLPAARNHGLRIAKGEYVFHCDSDDFVEPDMLQSLYDTAISENADIVWCDWFLSLSKNERYMRQPLLHEPQDAIRAMLSGSMKFNVWNKLVRRSLYTDNGITFPAGYGMGEDMTMIKLFAFAQKIQYLPKAFYHYVKTNTSAFSKTYSDKHLSELRYNIANMEIFIRQNYGESMTKELAFLRLEAKFPLLLSSKTDKFKYWREWYPESNAYILSNKNIPLRNRLLQWCAWKNLWWVVRVYSTLYNCFVYGMIYK